MLDIRFHGHSSVQVTSEGHSIMIDPFISGSPVAATKLEDISVQYILLTHGHQDHILDAVELAKKNDATIVATHELATYLSWQGVKTISMNLGGSIKLPFGKVKMTQAFHSSGVVLDDEKQIVYMGMPGGFVIELGGKTIYHAGDTGLFGDMKLIGERHNIDLAFLPIGDVFTMGPEDALVAAEWVQADFVVPIHYDTFPPIKQDGEAFVAELAEKDIRGKALKPGETLRLP
ncbi:metal-dependent hydrolase [Brevibacillus formosus]|uniref:metal-dependent hydrolase n=1 Tax=Brevibacillus TaxID=55080 RepID=UPI000B380C2D|nr:MULTISPECIES: metal-dependent hydrolase [Brevibacillus]MBG9943579.1 metal-dependent hydrolase [Brevibacillus formosus]MBW5467886.1 metal-dependent hydrolase [Brevibacillus formosus]MED1948136.1 metal-dependent hydrolase [Brevibacillus formosus]MED1998133.1 metal-dependent hydrolase [Brevibacillus formosus]MED2080674.1 metal-dependent hydrolase [Brevibacillus formosus]